MSPSTGSAWFYFQTNVLGFTPEFLGQLKLILAIGLCLSFVIYYTLLKHVQFKKQFIITCLISVFLGFLSLILITRKNLEYGIPDKVFSICDNFISMIIAELNLLPILVLACRMCPKNIEATMYAMLTSTINLGSFVSGLLGSLLIYLLGITDTVFDNFWLLVVITSSIQALPLLLIKLIDSEQNNQYQQEKKKNDDDEQYRLLD
ncbi:hypothetical protein IMG5_060130 [Ichthyophthirius multifiliis]|uniref:Uncharacterized protein n=1 Tax=Ichthyophthirius multifiliis TaxID=5932 RepID=G0QNM9_ICHMU|nr:hypothetical protein IMG5_060130 [Ichthyophthirius multifiliis]EGR33174.1 hypothetical protein IMG5_060130 [Ichthyophthirius multifiliis]|eukprot:XP_004037160.1 hypothetical protein IMG5_060130 [Ichthyophthirius multifiliis]